MAKRQASTEINHDNWNEEEEKEEAGTFTPVEDSKLQGRVIRKAKRTLTGTRAEDGSSTASAAFKGFSGFVVKTSSPNFSFLSPGAKPSESAASKSSENVQNGVKDTSKQPPEEPASVQQQQPPPKKQCRSSDSGSSESQELEYFKMLRKLNESVIQWLQLHYSKNPCCNFCPVFNDYQKHVHELEAKYLDKAAMKSQSSAPLSAMFKMPDPAVSKVSETSSPFSAKATQSLFEMKDNSNKSETKFRPRNDSEMLYGANFASNTTNTSSFSFGMQTNPTATSTGSTGTPNTSSSEDVKQVLEEEIGEEKKTTTLFPFGFKGSSTEQNKDDKQGFGGQSKPFTFGFTPTSTFNSDTGASDEPYEPPENDFSPVTEDDALYSKRCKLFYKKDNEYVDKGIGTLYLKSLENKTQLLIRADTNLGNILLNVNLSSSLPMERTGKNNVILVCVPNPPVDPKGQDSKQAIPLLIRVKTREDADELFEKFNKYKC